MSLPRFLEISSAILQENILNINFGVNTTYSFPVLANYNGKLVDAMFLHYAVDVREVDGFRPYAWILLDSTTGEAVLLANCSIIDFADTAAHPMDEIVSLLPNNPLSSKQYTQYFKQLYEVYEQLRVFAFEKEPNDLQVDIMEKYVEIFMKIVPKGHLTFYMALSGDFFKWLGILQDPKVNKTQALPPALEQDKLVNIQQILNDMAKQFTKKIAVDESKDKIIDSMHMELLEYKNGLLGTITELLERDIIKIIDDIGKTIEAYRGRAPTRENYGRFFSLFEGIQTDLADLLYRQGVEPYSIKGDKVEIIKQQILATVPTTNKDLDKTVAERHANGWEKNGKIIRPERISVYVHTPTTKVK